MFNFVEHVWNLKVGAERLEEQKVMFLLWLLRRLLTLGFILWLSPEKIEKAGRFPGSAQPAQRTVVVCFRTDVRFGDLGPVSLVCLVSSSTGALSEVSSSGTLTAQAQCCF